jgi:hypothetical protein
MLRSIAHDPEFCIRAFSMHPSEGADAEFEAFPAQEPTETQKSKRLRASETYKT